MQSLYAPCRYIAIFVAFAAILLTGEVVAQPPTAADDTPGAESPAAATVAERTVKLSEDRITMVAPEGWIRKKPRTNIVQYEFSIPSTEDDPSGPTDGAARLTIMGAGGGVEANVARWVGQFKAADDQPIKNAADPVESEVAGQKIHWVDLSGTYADSPRGPFGPKTNRPGYRMLSAIIATKEQGQYFVKCYGPAKTVAAAEKSFKGFIQSLKLQPAVDSAQPDEKNK